MQKQKQVKELRIQSETIPTDPPLNAVFRIPTTFIASAFMSISLMVNAQTTDPSVDPDGQDPGWPREYEKNGHQVVMNGVENFQT